MTTFGMISFIIFLAIAVGLFIYVMVDVNKLVKSTIGTIDNKKNLKKYLIFVLTIALSLTVSIFSIYLWMGISPLWWEILATIVFVFLFGLSLSAFFVTFRTHYYRQNIPEKVDKILYYVMISCIPVMIITLLYSFNGFARYIEYPIVNALSFTQGFVNTNTTSTSGVTISFYAICILGGAIFVYFLSDHKLYQQFGKHGMAESTFYVAFPAGIIGARIWYVIGNWTVDGFDKDPIRMFYIWEGGLTILGGAITGIVVGVLWFRWRNKGYNTFAAIDVIIPTILLAQAIGRFGNFFNCEVHGNPVSIDSWQWLPMIITYNGQYSSTAASLAGTGTFYLPLFIIEGFFNVLGYFVLSWLFGKVLRKYTELGDLAIGYVVVYGLIRCTLEPLRYGSYNMGENGYWSWIFSVLFVLFGALGIFANHLVRYLLRRKHSEQKAIPSWHKGSLISMIVLYALGAILLITGIILMSVNTVNLESLEYNGFNVGVLLLVFGVSLLIFGCDPLLYYIESRKVVTKEVVDA